MADLKKTDLKKMEKYIEDNLKAIAKDEFFGQHGQKLEIYIGLNGEVNHTVMSQGSFDPNNITLCVISGKNNWADDYLNKNGKRDDESFELWFYDCKHELRDKYMSKIYDDVE